MLACASTSTGNYARCMEDQSCFLNIVLIANTSTPPLDDSKTSVKMIEEVKHLIFSKYTSYRRFQYARNPRKVLISGSGVYEWSGKNVRKI